MSSILLILSITSMSKNTLYFGIPLISRGAAKDWDTVVHLFNNTLASIYNQSNGNFQIIVACHDIPEIKPQFTSRTQFTQVNSPIPITSAEKMVDKTIKKLAIGYQLRLCDGGYLMFLDADDLVHCHLVEYVLSHQHPHGYILKRGYELDTRQQKIRPLKSLDQLCGSCAIVYFQSDDLPTHPQDDSSGTYFSQFKAHPTWEQVAARHHRPLANIPFEVVIYVRNTGQNHSSFVPNLRHRLRLKQKLLALLENRLINAEICKNFCIQFPYSSPTP